MHGYELGISTQEEATHPVWQQQAWLFDTWTPHKVNVLQQVLNSMGNYIQCELQITIVM